MKNILSPQPGPQTDFSSSSADIVIFGGAAGGGKTYALLLEFLRYKNVQGFNAVIFRKNYTQVAAAGGLWDTSLQMFSGIKGARALRSPKYSWNFGGKSTLAFDYLSRENDVYAWQVRKFVLSVLMNSLTSANLHFFICCREIAQFAELSRLFVRRAILIATVGFGILLTGG